jgi:hypothetical protein
MTERAAAFSMIKNYLSFLPLTETTAALRMHEEMRAELYTTKHKAFPIERRMGG